jgi:hypothetical protein
MMLCLIVLVASGLSKEDIGGGTGEWLTHENGKESEMKWFREKDDR